jgi:hypothetical protein
MMPYKITDLHTAVSLLTQLEPRMSRVLELLGRVTGSTSLSWEMLGQLAQLVLLDLQGLPVLVLQEQLVRLERQVSLGKLVLQESELLVLLAPLVRQGHKEQQVWESVGRLEQRGLREPQEQSERQELLEQLGLGSQEQRAQLERRVLRASKERLEWAVSEQLGRLVQLGQMALQESPELQVLGRKV